MAAPMPREEAARRFRAALAAAGLTPYQAAAKLGVPPSRLYELASERKPKVPDWARLLWLIRGLDLDPTILMPELFHLNPRGEADQQGAP